MIELKLTVTDIPKDKIFKGEKGSYLTIQVSEMQQPDAYGNTHTAYIWDKDTKSKIYIGKGKKRFEDGKPATSAAATPSPDAIDDLPF